MVSYFKGGMGPWLIGCSCKAAYGFRFGEVWAGYYLGVTQRCIVGLDLGGTNVRARAYFEDGTPAGERVENSSRGQQGTTAILDAIAETVQQASAGLKPLGLGMAIPGHIDNERGMVRWAPNFGEMVDGVFRNWENVPIREPLSNRLSMPIFMDNDANLAALGEYKFGSGRNTAKCLVLITIGTGIGGGVIMAPTSVVGKATGTLMLVGGNKGGAELGHTVILAGGLDCNAGSYGALEGYCQRDSIIRRAQHKIRRGRKTVLSATVEGDLGKITPRMISDAANQGDAVAIEVWEEVGTYLGIGMGNFINIFAPDVLAVGGQIAKAGEFLLGPARKAAQGVAIPSLFADVKIGLAEQIDDAGLLGGAALALEATR